MYPRRKQKTASGVRRTPPVSVTTCAASPIERPRCHQIRSVRPPDALAGDAHRLEANCRVQTSKPIGGLHSAEMPVCRRVRIVGSETTSLPTIVIVHSRSLVSIQSRSKSASMFRWTVTREAVRRSLRSRIWWFSSSYSTPRRWSRTGDCVKTYTLESCLTSQSLPPAVALVPESSLRFVTVSDSNRAKKVVRTDRNSPVVLPIETASTVIEM